MQTNQCENVELIKPTKSWKNPDNHFLVALTSPWYKVLVKILALLLLSPKVFIVDNLLSYLKEDKRKLLLKYLKEKEISFINITTDAEEILFSDVVVVINNFKSVISGSPKSILEGNSILPYMGIKLPFIVDLSHNLILYNVVDKIYCDNRKLVDKLWK